MNTAEAKLAALSGMFRKPTRQCAMVISQVFTDKGILLKADSLNKMLADGWFVASITAALPTSRTDVAYGTQLLIILERYD